jgi:hypothetical protein
MRRRAIALLFVAGCGHHLCARHSDCPAAEVCTPQGVCAVASTDAGTDATPDDDAAAQTPADAAADAAPDAPADGA